MTKTFIAAALLGILTTGCGLGTETNGNGNGNGDDTVETSGGYEARSNRTPRGHARDGDDDGEGGEGGGNEGGAGGQGGGDVPPCDGDNCDEPEVVCYEVTGNPTCEDLQLGTELLRVDPPQSGTYDAGAATFTIETDGGMLDFDTTVAVDAIILKAGNRAMVCTFSEKVSAADDLAGPVNPNNDKLYDLSHVDFCVD